MRPQALLYYRSVPRYLLSKLLSRFWPRRFFHRVAPLKLTPTSPAKPPPGWVLLRNRLCGICGSDLNLLKGAESYLLEPYASFPAVLGHEVVAEVAEPPAGALHNLCPGQRVVVEPVLACQARGLPPCRFCLAGDYNLCENFLQGGLPPGAIIGYMREVGGGMAGWMTAPPQNLVTVPENLPDEAAVLTDSLASALQPVLQHFPAHGDTVVIYGAGIIAQHLLRSLRVLGSAARVVVAARHPFQQELARAGGADAALISPDRRQLGEALKAKFLPTTLGGGNLEGGADWFFDCVGSTSSLQQGLLALRGRGTYVLVGNAASLGPVDLSSLWFRELRLTGSAMYAGADWRGARVRTYQMAVDLLGRGDYPLAGLLSHCFPLEQYRQAFETAFDKRRYQSVKVAFDLRQ
jgi:threonine dehydrogenase-like Zn-dependent dehydrogenase